MRKTCEECGGAVVKKKIDFIMFGENLGAFPAEVCKKCNEEVYDEDVAEKITVVMKKKGLWGLEARTKVGIVGNSLDVKIGKKIAEFTGLKKGEEVRIHPASRNRIIIDIV